MKFRTCLFLFAIAIFTSCGNQTNEQAETTTVINPDSLSDFPSIPDSVVLGALNDFTASYEGSINDKYEITMQLIKVGNSIGGYYSYKNKGTKIWLNGSVLEDGSIDMPEINKGTVTGVFKGKIANNKFTGTWSKADNSKSMPFNVSQTSIASMQTKADVLSNAMGQYYLRSISGSVGANAMFDTYLEKGKWLSVSSSNVGGEREGTTIKLTEKDLELLNNLRVVVDDNMDVHVYAGLIELVKSPYTAKGMDYSIKQTDKTKMHERISYLSPDTIKYENKYILIAKDKISFTQTLKGSFDIVTEDNMILTYFPFNNTFELEIFWGECCDSNVLIFDKK
ncbi:MAG: hypothetical protein IPG89_19460 [Bacteroidetes bacterium]|nr:hypothetical protein [Bacteroidota bacterium]